MAKKLPDLEYGDYRMKYPTETDKGTALSSFKGGKASKAQNAVGLGAKLGEKFRAGFKSSALGKAFSGGLGSSASAGAPKTSQSKRPLPGKVSQANRPMPKPKAEKSFTAAPKPARKPYVAKGPAPYSKDVGDFYLNATAGMFSKDAGGNKKKR